MLGALLNAGKGLSKIVHLLPFALAAESIATPLFFRKYEDPKEKNAAVAAGAVDAYINLSLSGKPWQIQLAGSMILPLADLFAQLGPSIPTIAEIGISDESLLAIPFSRTSINMDTASAHLQFAQQQMQQAYGTIEQSQARIFASRMLTR